ncbi:MAG: Cerebroside-sulfatase [Puniceicoccaceae bacterium]|nr:MAG: Cerebroside-sulfatase [Puniceicoccaceae bacterium]
MAAQPNIILVNCDDLGYGDLGCYGSSVNRTPHLDRLAREGMRFTDFYMASAVCSPSRCAMMTGCYPPRIGCGEFDGKAVLFPADATGLHPDETTVARCLKDAGYATAIVGKWHCGDQPEFLPTHHGFDHYYGLPYSNDMGLQKVRPDARVPLPLLRDEEVIQQQPDQTGLTERYVEESIRFLRANRDRPFFLYFAHMHVHLPLLVSERFLSASQNGPYGAAVECIDWAMGALLHELEALGIDENTLIVFTSDNGSRARGEGGSNGPLRGHKGQLWEGGIRLPCIVRWPGWVPAGTVNRTLFSSLDFLPTFCALAGAPLPGRPIDGKDFANVLRGEAVDGPRDGFAYYWKNSLCAVRSGKWKRFVAHNEGQKCPPAAELYDLEADPGETTNLYEQHPEVVRRLDHLLERFREDIGDDLTGAPGANRRPSGRVANPVPLCTYDPDHPYMIASYDGPAG